MTMLSLEAAEDKVAIIGLSARFPGARNYSEFWNNLRDGVNSISQFTDEELIAGGIEPSLLRLPNYVKAGGVCEGSFRFDAPFFGYTPREAEIIDPQQRIFMEGCWDALEDAGYNTLTYGGRIGLFGGGGATQYLFRLLSNRRITRSVNTLSLITSNDKDYLATRVGYKLNLRGPCLTVQTACSTSLVAVVLGCQSVLNYQSDIALAGGVRTDYNERRGYMYEEGGINSPDGLCRTFDAGAAGTIWGGGTGVVVLKRYADALRDGDDIRAVILGYGMNNDGTAKVGFTAPGVEGQSRVTAEALAMAGINPETISFVECHGTATPIGDPIEIQSLTRAFSAYTQKKQFCAVASVKTNIGHTDSAAGAAGLIKTVLSLQNKQIPASLNYKQPNPKIDFANSPFYVNDKLAAWPDADGPRRAGVNSFGIGGTNAHVIVEEAPDRGPTGPSRPLQLLLLSAKSPSALEGMSFNLAAHLAENEPVLADVALTLQVGRARFSRRRAIVCSSSSDAIEKLTAENPPASDDRSSASVAFMFPGQGAQHPNMGRELYESEPEFRHWVDTCADLLRPALGLDLRTLLYPQPGQEDQAAEQLSETRYTQPALFVIEYAMAQLWMKWGLEPAAMIGHSIGEYVAACLAGVFSLEDALRLVAERGRLMQQLPRGAMSAVLLPEPAVLDLLADHPGISVAAVNNAQTTIVAGPTPLITGFEERLDLNGIGFRRLHTSHAFHSEMMDPALEGFRAVASTVSYHYPTRPFISNVSGTWMEPVQATDPEYWVRHLRATVRFTDGASTLLAGTSHILLEVGPGRTLCGLLSSHRDRTLLPSMHHAMNGKNTTDAHPGLRVLLTSVGSLWTAGVDLNWSAFYSEEQRRRIPLPTYPFEREEYKAPQLDMPDNEGPQPLTGTKQPMSEWFYFPSWKRTPPMLRRRPEAGENWLLLMDELGLGAKLGERLRAAGAHVVEVTAGSRYTQADASHFSVQPAHREDYTRLLSSLKTSGLLPAHVVHLWAVTPRQAAEADLANAEATLDRIFFSSLHLASELGEVQGEAPVSLSFVSTDMQDVAGDSVSNPVKSTLIGPSRVIPREYASFASRAVDIALTADGSLPAGTVDILLTELVSVTKDEVIAYRGEHRWAQGFERTSVPAAAESKSAKPELHLREGGVYLVTGAMGGIGGVLAEHLARSARGKLILVGRTAFPGRSHWDLWLRTHPAGNSTSAKIRQYLEWEQAGAEIEIAIADVSQLAQLEAVVDRAVSRFGAIHGVIHSAGAPGQGLMQLKTEEAALKVLAPKIMGTLNLENTLRGQQLDFFVLCSSLTGYLGVHGQCDYVAANAFMDAFAQARKGKGPGSPVSIDWDRWDEVGMVIATTTGEASRMRQQEVHRRLLPVENSFFFTHCVEEENGHTYLGVVSAEKHWPIGQHRLMGVPTLVGTSYVELARAAFTHFSNCEAVEVRDVLFLSPLMLAGSTDRELNVVLREYMAGQYEFTVRSRSADSDWQDHAVGRIGAGVKVTSRRDLAAMLAHMEPGRISESAAAAVEREDDDLVQAEERWNNAIGMAVLPEEALATIRLPDDYAGDVADFVLHPAMMDTATGFAEQFARRGSSYLPFSYNTVRISRPMPQQFHSFARFKPATGPTDEFLSFDLVMVDEQGDEILAIEGYGLKRVSDTLLAQFTPALESRNGLTRALEFADSGECILSSEGVEVLTRTLSLLPAPQVAISTLGLDYMVASSKPLRYELDSAEEEQMLTTSHARPHLSTPYVEPHTAVETMIASAWGGVLGLDQIGIHDNFIELGGHSLLATQVVARIRELFEINYSVASFYKTPTVAESAEAILQIMMEGVDADVVDQILQQMDV